ncbi:MAG: hypothetical protein J7D60_10125 [Prosthecochloris sp.]|nr:hypothetical protein [Prosthecochloris sp.]
MEKQEVVVTDIQMPFWSMVKFMIKWAIASIPAIIILYFLVILLVGLFAGLIYIVTGGAEFLPEMGNGL